MTFDVGYGKTSCLESGPDSSGTLNSGKGGENRGSDGQDGTGETGSSSHFLQTEDQSSWEVAGRGRKGTEDTGGVAGKTSSTGVPDARQKTDSLVATTDSWEMAGAEVSSLVFFSEAVEVAVEVVEVVVVVLGTLIIMRVKDSLLKDLGG